MIVGSPASSTRARFSVADRVLRRPAGKVEAREAFLKRLHALAHTHSLLTENEWRGAKLSALIEGELRPYVNHVSFEGEELLLTPRAALILGLVLHELATNAVKHGALGTSEGGIELAWRVEDGVRFWFRWRERGGPAVCSPWQRGFGSRLLEQAVTYELQGQASLEFAPEGVRYEITVPLRELVQGTCVR